MIQQVTRDGNLISLTKVVTLLPLQKQSCILNLLARNCIKTKANVWHLECLA